MQGDNWCELQMRNSRNSFLPHQVSLPCLRFMGGSKEEEEEEPRQYSWDVARQTLDLSQFTIDRFDLANECGWNPVLRLNFHKTFNFRLIDGETGRKPGAISGQQFQIKNCNNSHIYLFDWSNTVTVDDCINCKIFIGPVKVEPVFFSFILLSRAPSSSGIVQIVLLSLLVGSSEQETAGIVDKKTAAAMKSFF